MNPSQILSDKSLWHYLWPLPSSPHNQPGYLDTEAETLIFHWVYKLSDITDDDIDNALEVWNEVQSLIGLQDEDAYFVMVDMFGPIDPITRLDLMFRLNSMEDGYHYAILDPEDPISISASHHLTALNYDTPNIGILVIHAEFQGTA